MKIALIVHDYSFIINTYTMELHFQGEMKTVFPQAVIKY